MSLSFIKYFFLGVFRKNDDDEDGGGGGGDGKKEKWKNTKHTIIINQNH